MGREIASTQNTGTPSTFWSLGAVIEDAGDGRLVISSSSTVDDVGNLRRTLINRHIDEAVNREWPAMAQHGLTLASPPTALIEALQLTVSLRSR